MKNSRNIFIEWFNNLREPWKDYVFTGYFVGFVVLVGLVGVYPSIIEYINNDSDSNHSFWPVIQNILTYSIALAIPAAVSILCSKNKTNKQARIIFTVLLFILLPIALCILEYIYKKYICAFICLFLSWIVWVIGNHGNPQYHDGQYGKSTLDNAKRMTVGW